MSVGPAAATGTFAVVAGDTGRTIAATLACDVLAESNETLTLTPGNASAAGVASGEVTATIEKDEATPTLTIASAAA